MFQPILDEYIASKPVGSDLTLLETLSKEYRQELKATHIIGSGCFGCVFDLGDDTVVKLTTDQEEIDTLKFLCTHDLLDHPGIVSIFPESIIEGILPKGRIFATYQMERIVPLWEAGLSNGDFKTALDSITAVSEIVVNITQQVDYDLHVQALRDSASLPYMGAVVSLILSSLEHGSILSDIHHGNFGFKAFERYTPLTEGGLVLFDPIAEPLKLLLEELDSAIK